MSRQCALLLGTPKGVFILDGEEGRRDWRLRGPLCDGWPIHDVSVEPVSGALLAGGGSPWFGPAVWRSDGGESWLRSGEGLPQREAYLGVLREAIAVDRLDPVGVYFGTSTGQLYGSADEGLTWSLIADHLPPIWSVEAAVSD